MTYQVISLTTQLSHSSHDGAFLWFTSRVQRKLDEGWVPQGGIAISEYAGNITIAQALVKLEDTHVQNNESSNTPIKNASNNDSTSSENKDTTSQNSETSAQDLLNQSLDKLQGFLDSIVPHADPNEIVDDVYNAIGTAIKQAREMSKGSLKDTQNTIRSMFKDAQQKIQDMINESQKTHHDDTSSTSNTDKEE